MGTLYVGSILELHTTLIGWLLNNLVFDILTTTLLVGIPFISKIISTMQDADTNTFDAPGGELSANRLKWEIPTMIMIYFITMVPWYPIAPSVVAYSPKPTILNPNPSDEITGASDTSGYSSISAGAAAAATTIVGQLTHIVATGITKAVTDNLPQRPDYNAFKAQLSASNIDDPTLANGVASFTKQCYIPARNEFSKAAASDNKNGSNILSEMGALEALEEHGIESLDWIGSEVFLAGAGLYQRCFDTEICGATIRPNMGGAATSSAETCADWWNNDLKPALLNKSDPTLWTQLVGNVPVLSGWTAERRERAQVKNLLANYANSGGPIDGHYGTEGREGAIEHGWGAIKDAAGMLGSAYEGAFLATELHVAKQAVPMIVAILLMLLYFMMPFIYLFSGYSVGAMVTVMFIHFSLVFMSAIRAVAAFIDSYLTDAFFPSGDELGQYLSAEVLYNTQKVMILNVITSALYIALPVLWFMFLSWAGVKSGSAAAEGFNTLGRNATRMGGGTKNFTKKIK